MVISLKFILSCPSLVCMDLRKIAVLVFNVYKLRGWEKIGTVGLQSCS